MIKYKARFNLGHGVITIILLIYLVLTSHDSFVKNYSNKLIIESTIFFLVVFGLLFFIMIYFTYIKIDQNKLTYVLTLVHRRKVDIDKIIEIKNEPLFPILGKNVPSIGIVYRERERINLLKINPNPFPEKKIREFIALIKEKNPDIKIDEYWQKRIK